jgi:hypothetical protein
MMKLSTYMKIMSLLSLTIFFVACGNNNGGSGSSGRPVGLIGAGTCASCPAGWGGSGSTLFLGSGYGSGSASMAMSIEIVGDPVQIQARSSQGVDPSKTYQGQIYLRQAAINVPSLVYSGNCVIPPGSYTISATPNSGTYSGGSFVIQQVDLVNTANSALHVLVSLQQGAIVASYYGGPAQGFGAMMYLVAGPSAYNGQIMACNDTLGIQLAQ